MFLYPGLEQLMVQFFRRYFSNQVSLLDVVSKLRNRTALSMNLCHKAATEANLDYNIALEILSKSANMPFKPTMTGVSKIGKEGLIGIMGTPKRKCIIEVKYEIIYTPKFIF